MLETLIIKWMKRFSRMSAIKWNHCSFKMPSLPPSLSPSCLHLHMPPFVFHTSLQSQFFMIFKRLLRSPCPYTPRQRWHLLSPTPPPDLFVSYFIKQYPGIEGFVFVSCGAPTAAGDVSPSAPTEWRRVIRWEVNTQLQTWHVHVSPSISHKKKKRTKTKHWW